MKNEPDKLINRLGTILNYAMLSPSDAQVVRDAIDYIKSNEERMKVSRPNPLFGSIVK